MPAIHPGRFTAQIEGDFVVFVIGMRFNKLHRVDRWAPIAASMPRMVRELLSSPIKGLLHVESGLARRSTLMVQYWRTYDDLERFARDGDDLHLPAWRRYNKVIGSSGDVGVYHETYKISAGDYEAVYANMPAFGLAKAGSHLPIGEKAETSRERIAANQGIEARRAP